MTGKYPKGVYVAEKRNERRMVTDLERTNNMHRAMMVGLGLIGLIMAVWEVLDLRRGR